MRCFIPLLLLGSLAAAEISFENSVEWSVVDSDLVVRGRVVAVKAAAIEDDNGWHRVTLAVEETLKGKARKSVEFIYHSSAKDKELALWLAKKTEMVCFLVRSERYAKDEKHAALAAFALGVDAIDMKVELSVTEEEETEAGRLLEDLDGPFVLMNPGANKEAKRWPAERFAQVADALAGKYVRCPCGNKLHALRPTDGADPDGLPDGQASEANSEAAVDPLDELLAEELSVAPAQTASPTLIDPCVTLPM